MKLECPNCSETIVVSPQQLDSQIQCENCGKRINLTSQDKYVISKLKDQVLKLEKENEGLKEQSTDSSTKNLSEPTSLDGLESLLLRLDYKGVIKYVNSTFCTTFQVSKSDLLDVPLKTLKPILPLPLYHASSMPEEEGIDRFNISDGKGKTYDIKKTLSSNFLDLVLNDITDKQKFQDLISKYVNKDLVELEDGDLQTFKIPERRMMTVSFTDLRGFTAMSELLKPEEVRSTLNIYLEEIIQAINNNGATVDKIIGDEVMALYGAPKYYKDHALRAIKTACEQIENLKNLQEKLARVGKHIPDCGIGINTGDMVVGNMGSSTHLDYTVLGSSVNLAASVVRHN